MPPGVAFALGMLEDLLSGGPPGVWALSFVVPATRWSIASAMLSRDLRVRRDLGFRRGDAGSRARRLSGRRDLLLAFPPLAPLMMQFAVTICSIFPGSGSQSDSSPLDRSRCGATSDAAVRPQGQEPLRDVHAPHADDGRRRGAVLAALGARLYQLQIVEGDEYMTAPRRTASTSGCWRRCAAASSIASASNSPTTAATIACCSDPRTGDGRRRRSRARHHRPHHPAHRSRPRAHPARHRREQEIRAGDGRRKSDLGGIRARQSASALSLRHPARCRRDARLSVRRRSCPMCWAMSPRSRRRTKNDDDPLLAPGFRIGKRGIEKAFDSQCAARPASAASKSMPMAASFANWAAIRERRARMSISPSTTRCSISPAQRLGDESAACVVMDVTNGDVLALASTPGFDPNLFNVGITPAQWHGSHDRRPHAAHQQGDVGRLSAGLDLQAGGGAGGARCGRITPDFSVDCTGSITLGNHVFHCWKKGGHGMSICTAASQVLRRLLLRSGAAARHRQDRAGAHKLGLGSLTAYRIPGEKARGHPGRAWKEATFGVPWQQGETLNTGIGQGYVLVTPIQLCTLAARIASGNAGECRASRAWSAATRSRARSSSGWISPMRAGGRAVRHERRHQRTRAARPMPGASQSRLRNGGQDRHGAGARISKEERADRREEERQACPGICATTRCSSPSRPCAAALCLLDHPRAWRNVGRIPQVQMARDILLFTQQRDPVKLPTAYPVNAAGRGQWRGRSAYEFETLCRRKRTLSIGDKLLEINWGSCCSSPSSPAHRFRDALFGGGRAFQPWARRR
jgi:hypothetical protein